MLLRIRMEGDLVEGLSQLFKEYIPPNTLEVEFDLSLNDGPILDYPKGTSIGLIFMDIVRKFSFYAEIYSTSNPIVKVTLKEGRNGCPNLEP